MLPKFLIADNSQQVPENIYVVHTEAPRCIFECNVEEDFFENHIIHWIDEKPADSQLTADLTQEAGKFLDMELEAQEDLFSEEFMFDDEDDDFDGEEEEEEKK